MKNVRTIDQSRDLYIDFDLYTEGDPEFKKELVAMIIGNLKELQQSLRDAMGLKVPDLFLRATHKMKVCIMMLNDSEFSNATKAIECIFESNETQVAPRATNEFHSLCDNIIGRLQTELKKV